MLHRSLPVKITRGAEFSTRLSDHTARQADPSEQRCDASLEFIPPASEPGAVRCRRSRARAQRMSTLGIIGCGFVADLYARALAVMPGLRVAAVYDRDAARLRTFCEHWSLPAVDSLDALLAALPADGIVLNLTNPDAHFEINRACLIAGRHVYSEKPLAMRMEQARSLHALAAERGLMLSSAPCSVLGEAARIALKAWYQAVAKLEGEVVVTVNGYSDPLGPAGYNRNLAEQRARAVARWWEEQGDSTAALQVEGHGEDAGVSGLHCQSVPADEMRACYQQDRRVELRIQ